MTVNLIAAVGRRGQIGRDGGLPWRDPADLAWFKRQTMGGTVIVGRTTFAGLPELRGREVFSYDGSVAPRDFIRSVRRWQRPIWIAGGAAIWRAFAAEVDGLKLISAIDYDSDPADDPSHVFFPFDAFGLSWGGHG